MNLISDMRSAVMDEEVHGHIFCSALVSDTRYELLMDKGKEAVRK